MGYWQNGLEIEKKVCDFKVTLGCLGLKLPKWPSGLTSIGSWHMLIHTTVIKTPLNFGKTGHDSFLLLSICFYFSSLRIFKVNNLILKGEIFISTLLL